MTNPAPAPSPRRNRPNLLPGLFIAFLPLGPLLFMQWGSSGAPIEKRVAVLVLVGLSIPLAIFSWLVWRWRNRLPRLAWRAALALDAIALVALFVAALVVALRPHGAA